MSDAHARSTTRKFAFWGGFGGQNLGDEAILLASLHTHALGMGTPNQFCRAQ